MGDHQHRTVGVLVELRHLELGAAGVVGAHHGDLVGVGHMRVGVLVTGRVVPLAGRGGGVVVLLQLDLVLPGLAADRVEIDLHGIERGVGGVCRVTLERQVHADNQGFVATTTAAPGLATRCRTRYQGDGSDRERRDAPSHAGPLSDRSRHERAEPYHVPRPACRRTSVRSSIVAHLSCRRPPRQREATIPPSMARA